MGSEHKPRVFFAAADRAGCGRVRSIWPAEALAARGWPARWGLGLPAPGTAEVVIIQRPSQRYCEVRIRELRAAGARVLVSDDDDLTRVSEVGSPQVSATWDAERQLAHDLSIRAADGHIVSTPELARVYGSLAARTWVIRNHLPSWIGSVRAAPPARDGQVRVGWAGITETHRTDLAWLAPVASEALAGAVFSTVGDPRTPRVLGVSAQAEVFLWERGPRDLYRRMARADIGIVPLAPTAFNRSKSWLKALEYLSLGIPVVAADLPEQRALLAGGGGLLAASPREFAAAVQALVGAPALRMELAAEARARAERLVLEERVVEWERMLEEVAGGGPGTKAQASSPQDRRGEPREASASELSRAPSGHAR